MWNFFCHNNNTRIDLERNKDETDLGRNKKDIINDLEREIKTFMDKQTDNIKSIFNDDKFKVQKPIERSNVVNNNFHTNENDINVLQDYVIQWSIEGAHYANSTRCNLTLFNIGSFLGANGFLESISLFYICFMKIPINNKTEGEIKKDIEDCLRYIDSGERDQLNEKWNININDNQLKNLQFAKDYLINQFQDKITEDIFKRLNNNKFKKIWNWCKTKFCNLGIIICFFISKKLSLNDYIKAKNSINRNYLIEELFNKLNLETFKNNNIFIIAIDNDTDSWNNYGATFLGYPLKGLGEKHRARKLILNDVDGFMVGNGHNKTEFLYKFYCNRINEIKKFFEENNQRIDDINKGLNININIREIAQDLDNINQKYQYQGHLEEDLSTRANTTTETDPERLAEMERIQRDLRTSNSCRETETLKYKQIQTMGQNNIYPYNRNEFQEEKEEPQKEYA